MGQTVFIASCTQRKRNRIVGQADVAQLAVPSCTFVCYKGEPDTVARVRSKHR
jgi:hypothetical protein